MKRLILPAMFICLFSSGGWGVARSGVLRLVAQQHFSTKQIRELMS